MLTTSVILGDLPAVFCGSGIGHNERTQQLSRLNSTLPVGRSLIRKYHGRQWWRTCFLGGASVACGRTIHSHNGLAPPPHAGHQPGHTLLWDGIPFFNQYLSQVSQRGCVGHSGTNSTPKLIPQVFNGVEVRTAGRPFHPLHSHILEVVSDKPRPVGASVVILEDSVQSQTVEIWDCHWLQNLISIALCIETLTHHTASTKRCYSIGAAISIAFSASSPHFDP
ncbi:uncharacterized protein LOC127353784 [Dicentrarchus labrax]|uniref:uncharacterized protein LOC127353784 n=1 Tax=Dicentrarchus labrax TaxID=13489 RepID=UPI0021F69A1E|nr:uncharacterized protein LOC127353784 [Dicentrarchus labrax]